MSSLHQICTGYLILRMVVCFNSSLSIHPTLSFPYCVCSLCLHLHCCPANRFLRTILERSLFLDNAYHLFQILCFSLFHLSILIFLFLPSLLNLTTICFQNHLARFQPKLDLVCYSFFFFSLGGGWGQGREQVPLLFLGYSKYF